VLLISKTPLLKGIELRHTVSEFNQSYAFCQIDNIMSLYNVPCSLGDKAAAGVFHNL
jgi:hypothetical protein